MEKAHLPIGRRADHHDSHPQLVTSPYNIDTLPPADHDRSYYYYIEEKTANRATGHSPVQPAIMIGPTLHFPSPAACRLLDPLARRLLDPTLHFRSSIFPSPAACWIPTLHFAQHLPLARRLHLPFISPSIFPSPATFSILSISITYQ